MVTMTFDAADPERLQSVLARYVVLSRGHPGCRNIDLAMSSTRPDRFVIVQKWERPEAQRAHFDSADMVDDGRGLRRAAGRPPAIDLLDAIRSTISDDLRSSCSHRSTDLIRCRVCLDGRQAPTCQAAAP